MLPNADGRQLKTTQAPLFSRIARKLKQTVKDFNEEDEGMNTVEAIILLFVAAVVLLVFFAYIWPLIREAVYQKLGDLFNSSGREGAAP